jgi:hypothetical protein
MGRALFILFILIMLIAAWHVEQDANRRFRQPIQCPAGVTAPADCE